MGQPPIKFRMLHAIVLVAGVAGCLSLRWTITVCLSETRNTMVEWRKTRSILLVLSHGPKLVSETSPLMAATTLTFLAIAFCPPRPRLAVMTRRPGFSALFTAALTLAMVVGLDVFDRWASPTIFGTMYIHPWKIRPFDLDHILNVAKPLPGYAVAAAWGLAWAGRRWRPAPNWLDVVGRVVGAYWIGMTLLAKFYPYLY